MTLDKKSAIQILNSRVLISTVGKFTVKVTGTQPFMREDGTAVTIINFAAMTQYQLGESKKAFAAGDYDAAANFNLSSSQLSGRYVPAKGEIVDVEISEIENKQGVNILVVDSIVPRQAIKAARISFSDEDDTTDVSDADMRKALVASGDYTQKLANKLEGEELTEAYNTLNAGAALV